MRGIMSTWCTTELTEISCLILLVSHFNIVSSVEIPRGLFPSISTHVIDCKYNTCIAFILIPERVLACMFAICMNFA